MTEARREAARANLYRLALGPLGLRHEDLWTITNGQLGDMLAAWQYKTYLEDYRQARHTVAIMNLWSKRKISAQTFTGVWYDGQVMSKEKMIERWKGKRRGRKAP